MESSSGAEVFEISASGTGPEKAEVVIKRFLVDALFSPEGRDEGVSKFRGLFFLSGEEKVLASSGKTELLFSVLD